MKSSSICWVVVVSLLAVAPAAGAKRGKQRSPDELVNVFLSPGRAQWLVGPIARLLSEDQIEVYLGITEEGEAERFIDEFWADRQPLEGVPGMTARQQFELLAAEADRRFGEATYHGCRTDRGTVFILYGPPDKVDYKPARRSEDGELEVWYYARPRLGLDGKTPDTTYHFIREGDLTRFATGAEKPKLLP